MRLRIESSAWTSLVERVEKGKLALDANGMTIPLPQREVYLHDYKKQNTVGV